MTEAESSGQFKAVQELMHAKLSGVRIEDAATTYERLTGKILIDYLKPSALIFSDGFHVSGTTRLLKRAIDLVLALLNVVFAAPLKKKFENDLRDGRDGARRSAFHESAVIWRDGAALQPQVAPPCMTLNPAAGFFASPQS